MPRLSQLPLLPAGSLSLLDEVYVRDVSEANPEDQSKRFLVSGFLQASGIITPQMFGTVGTADDTAVIQAAIAAADALGVDVTIPGGTYNHETLTVPAGVTLKLDNRAVLNHLTWNANGIVLGAGSKIIGGKLRSPATWDGTNTEWTYAVVYTTADDTSIIDVTLENVPKVGIGFKNGSKGTVRGCRIYGNYPLAQWTGVETAHFGIAIDPGGGTYDGSFTLGLNIITTCVQGTFVGNYGTGAGRGITFSGNSVSLCWNHGFYGATGAGFSLTGNSFYKCQIPVAITGKKHTLTGNACFSDATGNQTDITGFSLRDPEGCTVIGNTFEGDAAATSVVINLSELNGTTCVDNVVAFNTIKTVGGSSDAIRIGSGNATTMRNNKVYGNTIRGVGRANSGLIALYGNSGTQAYGNSVTDNNITLLGDSNFVYVGQCVDTQVKNNHIFLEYDAPSAKTLSGVFITGASKRTVIEGNTFTVTAAWGTNVTLRCISENPSVSVVDGVYRNNNFSLDLTKLAAGVRHNIQSGSGAFVDERGPGAPSVAALIGSRWARTDGGAGTSLYVKESATDATGWVGK